MQKAMHRLYLAASRRLWGRWWGPGVLLISVPKAGTNLLRRVLEMLPLLRPAGTVALLPIEDQLARIATLGRGKILSTHLHWMPELEPILEQQDIRGLFISRDPRDICVSWFHYVMREARHRWHPFLQHLPGDEARLMAVITGVDEHPAGERRWFLPSIDAVFRSRLPYATHPRFCSVTFEGLIGPRGGGSEHEQKAAIRRIAGHLGLRLTTRDLDWIAGNAFTSTSPTFRRGRIGTWRLEMSDAHKETFKEVAGQLLIDLGYEHDRDW
jgi:hypothetical protein